MKRSNKCDVLSDSPFGIHLTIVVSGLFISMLGIIIYYIYAFAALKNGSSDFDWLLGIFSDFVAIMNDSLNNNPYVSGGTSYPPIAIFILYPFSLICKDILASFSGQALTIDELTSKVILHKEFWISMILFCLINSICTIVLISYKYRLTLNNTLKSALFIISSSPFIYIMMRGNTIYIALLFLMIFICFYEHNDPVVREASFIALVFAGAIKIYPLFFVVFLLNKKKYFVVIRIAIYSIGLFLLSFALSGLNINDISQFIKNLDSFASDTNRLSAFNNLSVSSLLYKFANIVIGNSSSKFFVSLNSITLVMILLLSTISATLTHSTFSRTLIASSTIVLFPQVSYFYVLSFMILPYFEFIKNYNSFDKRKRSLYNVLFMILFSSPLIMMKNFLLHGIAIIIMLVTEIYCVFTEKSKKQPC